MYYLSRRHCLQCGKYTLLGGGSLERAAYPTVLGSGFVDNDANSFCLGERYFGKGQTVSNFVGLTIGTGLGGGIIQQGASCLPMPIVDPVNLVKYRIRNIIWNIIAVDTL